LYGQYSQAADPSHNKDAKSVLTASPQNTTDLAVGVSILCPVPEIAKSKIPAFNATDFMKDEILNSQGKSWAIDPTPAAQATYLPAPEAEEGSSGEDDEDAWDAMGDSWQTMHDDASEVVTGGQGMLGLCARVLGWDADQAAAGGSSAGGAGDGKPWELSGKFPTKLVMRLKEYYPSLPRVGVS